MTQHDWQRPIEGLVGKTLISIEISPDADKITFKTDKDEVYIMEHFQDCCEQVYISDVEGDISDIIGSTILFAEEVSGEIEDAVESGTWTFYKLQTSKGGLWIRWNGYSNGYYSESVNFYKYNQ